MRNNDEPTEQPSLPRPDGAGCFVAMNRTPQPTEGASVYSTETLRMHIKSPDSASPRSDVIFPSSPSGPSDGRPPARPPHHATVASPSHSCSPAAPTPLAGAPLSSPPFVAQSVPAQKRPSHALHPSLSESALLDDTKSAIWAMDHFSTKLRIPTCKLFLTHSTEQANPNTAADHQRPKQKTPLTSGEVVVARASPMTERIQRGALAHYVASLSAPCDAAEASKCWDTINEAHKQLGSERTPYVCRLFQSNRCKQSARCNQVHVRSDTLDELRKEMCSTGVCCCCHTDPTTDAWSNQWMEATIRLARFTGVLLDVPLADVDRSVNYAAIQPPSAAFSTLSLPIPPAPSQELLRRKSSLQASYSLDDGSGDASLNRSSNHTAVVQHTLQQPEHDAVLLTADEVGGGLAMSSPAVLDGSNRLSSRNCAPAQDGHDEVAVPAGAQRIVPSPDGFSLQVELDSVRLHPTAGLRKLIIEQMPKGPRSPSDDGSSAKPTAPLQIARNCICRHFYADESRQPFCKFGDDCWFVHICRQTMKSLKTRYGMSLSVSTQPVSSPSSVSYRDPLSRVGATIITSDASNSNLTSQSAAASPLTLPPSRAVMSSSQEQQPLYHVPVDNPLPPRSNAYRKAWVNCPYGTHNLMKRRTDDRPPK